MNILDSLKLIPKEHHNLKIYHKYPKEVFKITEIHSEIFNFYDKDPSKKYQVIFFADNEKSCIDNSRLESLTVGEVIELLEKTISKNVLDIRFLYLSWIKYTYSCSNKVLYTEEGENPCYIIKEY